MIVNGTNGNERDQRRRRGHLGVGHRPGGAGERSTDAEGANDRWSSTALGGNDSINATTLPAGVIKLTSTAAPATTRSSAAQGADVFLGGDGNDFVFGDNGQRRGACWAPATTCSSGIRATATTRSKARTASTRCVFIGSNVSENFDIFANGGRALLLPQRRQRHHGPRRRRDASSFRALGGADNIVVGDLTGTDVTQVNLDLRGAERQAGDGAVDTVTVNATKGADVVAVSPATRTASRSSAFRPT